LIDKGLERKLVITAEAAGIGGKVIAKFLDKVADGFADAVLVDHVVAHQCTELEDRIGSRTLAGCHRDGRRDLELFDPGLAEALGALLGFRLQEIAIAA
jgi:hypothetical protein